jgi:3-oxoacyl-[acyl-carrier-protein] synthase II
MSVSAAAPRRVVITGIGVICPLGNSKETLWEGLSTRRSGVGPLRAVPTRYLPMSFAGEATCFTGAIDDFGPLEGEQKKAIRKGLKTICREAQMGIAAAQLALRDAGLSIGKYEPERTGVVFGSDYMITAPDEFTTAIRKCLGPDGRFQFSRWAKEGLTEMNPLWLLKYLPNMPGSHLAIYNDLRGPNNSLTLREASSNLAVGEALRYIQRGSADIMIAGATGTLIHPVKSVHAVMQQELAANGVEPARACRPFDLNRTGMVLGEGSAAIILEERAAAEARGVRILGEIIGAGSSQVAERNLVAHRRQALVNAMRMALRDAGAAPGDVGHIQAHGLATRTCDQDEAAAIRELFGPLADRLPVAAAKSYFGNLGAASGLVELVAGVLALHNQRLFPTLNYETPDPACPITVATDDTPEAGRAFLKLSVTPQGQASCVMVRAA